MPNNVIIFGGVDARIFDVRKFNIRKRQIIKLCEDFNLGRLISHNKEKGIRVSHSNFIFFVKTSRGSYVFKFSPLNNPRNAAVELALNRFLRKHNFNTPVMYTTIKELPFVKMNGYLVTCYKKISGRQLYSCRIDLNKIKKINKHIRNLNKLLLSSKKNREIYALLEKESFIMKVNFLTKLLKDCGAFSDRNLIISAIKKIYRDYLLNKGNFVQKPIHSNMSLSNMLYYNKSIFLLDLSHIRVDYELNDLANLMVSCYFFGLPDTKVSTLMKGYFSINNFGKEKLKILNILTAYHLTKEYLKTVKKEVNTKFYPKSMFSQIFKSERDKHKNHIAGMIKEYLNGQYINGSSYGPSG